MNEDQLNTLRQQDMNLRDAIRMDEMERPQMPADLNARLMKRMAEEQAKPQRRRMVWPWIAAACVAAVIAVYLTPPKASSPTPLQVERGVVICCRRRRRYWHWRTTSSVRACAC